MWKQGVYIVIGLPNSTSVSQEMNQLYQTFKSQCRKKTLSIFSEKIPVQSKRINECNTILRDLKYTPPEDLPDTVTGVDEIDITQDISSQNNSSQNDSSQDDSSQDNSSQDNSSPVSRQIQVALQNMSDAMKQPTLNNTDLAYIVNGRE